MKKKILFILFLFIIALLPVSVKASENLPCVFADGNLLGESDDFVLYNNSVYANAERLAEMFDFVLSSDADGYVHSFSDNVRTVTYDSGTGSVNIGDRHSFSHEIFPEAYVPYISQSEDDSYFVPLRMFCESFGIRIFYDAEKNEVYIERERIQKGLYNSSGIAISYRNGKYGLVNQNGTLILNYKYDDINNYDNDLLFKVTDNHRCGLVNSDAEIIIDVIYNEIIYESDTEIYLVSGNKKGMADVYGNIIIPVEYDEIIYCGNKIAMVKLGEKWRVLNCSTGEFGVKAYDNVYKVTAGIHTDNNQIKGYYVERNSKWGYVDSFGNEIINMTYDGLDKFDAYGRARVIQNDRFGIVDCGGTIIIPVAYDYLYPFGELDTTVAKVGSKYGIIDKNSNPVVPFEYDYIYPFGDSKSTICYKDKKFAVVSCDGTFLTGFDYSYAEPFKNGMALVYNNGYGYIDHNGNEIIECVHTEVKQGSALSMFLKRDDAWALYSSDGKNLTGFIYETAGGFSNGLSAVSIDINGKSRCGYVNDSGDIIIAHMYDTAQDFNYGKAIVSIDGKYGIIDVEGNAVIPFEYRGFNPSYDYNMIAAAGINGKWGVISFENSVICDFVYDYVFEYSNGYAVVISENKFGVIDTKGKIVIDVKYPNYDDAVRNLNKYLDFQ